MDDKKSEKPKDNEPKAEEDKTPKEGKADNQVIAAQAAGKDVGGEEVADSSGAPKDGEESGDDAGELYGLTTFLHLDNLPADQSHAFSVWAEHQHWGKLSLKAWSKRYEDFRKRRV